MDRDYTRLRLRMVECDLIARGISHPSVLDAMRSVSRHLFVTAGNVARAYDDDALSLPEGQISQPCIVALMAEQEATARKLLALYAGHPVLSIPAVHPQLRSAVRRREVRG